MRPAYPIRTERQRHRAGHGGAGDHLGRAGIFQLASRHQDEAQHRAGNEPENAALIRACSHESPDRQGDAGKNPEAEETVLVESGESAALEPE